MQISRDLRKTFIMLAAMLALLMIAGPVLAASEAQYASGLSINHVADWSPNPLGTNPFGAPDDNCVEVSTPPGSWGEFTFPAFSIPATDNIDGIEVRINYVSPSGSHTVQLTNGGLVGSTRTIAAVSNGQNNCSNTIWETAGNPTDLWGTTLTPADFNAGNVGFRITQVSNTFGIDAVELIVHHSSGTNTAPTADAGGPYSVNEGGSVVLSGAASSDPDQTTASLTFDWDLDNNGSYETPGISPTFSAAGLDGASSATVGLRVTDDGALSDTDTATVNINNVAPTIGSISVSSTSIDEGQSVTVSGSFSDPALGVPSETFSGTALWSDGVSTPLSVGGGTFSTVRSFPDDHPVSGTPADTFTVNVTISDDDGGSDAATSPVVTVNNVAPTIGSIIVSSTSINEGQSVTVSGSFSDPALGVPSETFSGTALWSDGVSTPLSVGGGTFSTARNFPDDDPASGTPADNFTVDVTISDDDGGSDTDTSPVVTVNNVPPTANAGPDQTVFRYDLVSVSGSWTDPAGSLDNLYSWTWDLDGDAVPDSNGNASFGDTVAETTSFALEGFYTLTFAVTDNDAGSDSASLVVEVLNKPPDCSNAGPSIDTLWPPNHKFVAIDVLGVTDPEGDPIVITVDSIFQDEAVDAPGSGNTSPDGQGVGSSTAEVRAERMGAGNGRFYHISYTADDGHGGSCSDEVLVGVPKSKGKKGSPVDDGALFDSTVVAP